MMRFIDGFKILLTNTWYNFAFILSLIATTIISIWIVIDPNSLISITDPILGFAISVTVSFQYFVIALVIFSLIPKGRELFFTEGKKGLSYQAILCIIFIVIFMTLGPITALAGPFVGVPLTFGDALITSYFAVLLGWNLGKTVSNRLGEKKTLHWVLFVLFWIVDFIIFGAAFLFLNLSSLPFEQQIVMLVFPLGIALLPIITILFRKTENSPDQTTLLTFVIFIYGLYYTYRLVSITDPQWAISDVILQLALLIYGLSTTISKIHDPIGKTPSFAVTIVLLIILSRVGSQVSRLLAAAIGLGPIVQVGITSFTILLLAILGLIVPTYWMWQRRKNPEQSITV
ncbi:MAG: hypothetical protein JW779_09620 [Candidatus Thorarchaeota archaeon]|nr:hypothetical protein [Candidatus Thorarchaeota archaeon]